MSGEFRRAKIIQGGAEPAYVIEVGGTWQLLVWREGKFGPCHPRSRRLGLTEMIGPRQAEARARMALGLAPGEGGAGD